MIIFGAFVVAVLTILMKRKCYSSPDGEEFHRSVIRMFFPNIASMYPDEVKDFHWIGEFVDYFESKFREGESFVSVMRKLYEWDIWVNGAWNGGLWTVEPVVVDNEDSLHFVFRGEKSWTRNEMITVQIFVVFRSDLTLDYVSLGTSITEPGRPQWAVANCLIPRAKDGSPVVIGSDEDVIDSHVDNMRKAVIRIESRKEQ